MCPPRARGRFSVYWAERCTPEDEIIPMVADESVWPDLDLFPRLAAQVRCIRSMLRLNG